jgi:hypothetical protein
MALMKKSHLFARTVLGAAVALSACSAIAAGAGTPISGKGTWETTLQGRELDGNVANGFEAYYDTVLDITWLADANYAATIGWVSPSLNVAGGWMTWDEGIELINNTPIYGISGWRAPKLTDLGTPGCAGYANGGTDCGYNVVPSSSEMVHLFSVTLGNHSVINPDGTRRAAGDFGVINSGPFKNIQKLPGYGLATPYAPDPTQIWAFNPSSGIQAALSRTSGGFGWPVHDGDIAAVPEPQTYALMGLGLIGIAAVARRKR